MKNVEVVCPMCDGAMNVPEVELHIGEPIRCGHCYEISSLIHIKDADTGEKSWRLDYLQDADD